MSNVSAGAWRFGCFTTLLLGVIGCGSTAATPADGPAPDAPLTDSPDAAIDAAGAPDAHVASTFALGGQVHCLTGSGLVLHNGSESISITQSGSFQFTTPMTDGDSYEVVVETQPTAPPQQCIVSRGTGTVSGHDVADIDIRCSGAPVAWIGFTQWLSNQAPATYVASLDSANCPAPLVDVSPPGVDATGTIGRTPDNKRMIFEVTPGHGSIYGIDLDSATPTLFGPISDGPSWGFRISPTSDHVAMLSEHNNVYGLQIVDVSTVPPPPPTPVLFETSWFWWSRRGDRLIALSTDPAWQAWVDAAGSPPFSTLLLDPSRSADQGDISGDGSRVVFQVRTSVGTRLYLDNIVPGIAPTPVPLTKPVGFPIRAHFTLDGNGVFYSDSGVAYFVDISGATPGPTYALTPLPIGTGIQEIYPSPDGKYVVAVGAVDRLMQADAYAIDLSGSVPGPPIKLTATLPIDQGVTLGPVLFNSDGSSAAFTATDWTDGSTSVYVSRMAPPSPAVAVAPPPGPQVESYAYGFSPDGAGLLFGMGSSSHADFTLYLADVSGAQPGVSQISAPPASNVSVKAMQPFFTPDGAAVVFAAAKSPTELPALHIVGLSGASRVPQRISEPGLEITSAVIATP